MILLLGGTLEGRQLANLLRENGFDFLISTVSDYGGQLAQEISSRVQVQALDQDDLTKLCIKMNIAQIIDATHPFAINISQNAIKTANKLGIPYMRFERENINLPFANPNVHLVNNISEASQLAAKMGNNILLTIGSRQLERFSNLIKKKQVYVRILPDLVSLQKCLNLGIKLDKILALQGPFSQKFNEALYKEKKIDLVISKNSGKIGGLDTKLAACINLKIPLIIIDRPQIDYPQVVYNFPEILKLLQEEKNGI